jgi:hypothetical protein
METAKGMLMETASLGTMTKDKRVPCVKSFSIFVTVPIEKVSFSLRTASMSALQVAIPATARTLLSYYSAPVFGETKCSPTLRSSDH